MYFHSMLSQLKSYQINEINYNESKTYDFMARFKISSPSFPFKQVPWTPFLFSWYAIHIFDISFLSLSRNNSVFMISLRLRGPAKLKPLRWRMLLFKLLWTRCRLDDWKRMGQRVKMDIVKLEWNEMAVWISYNSYIIVLYEFFIIASGDGWWVFVVVAFDEKWSDSWGCIGDTPFGSSFFQSCIIAHYY